MKAGQQPIPTAVVDRLESWKAVADYLNRSVRTVQRWEKLEGLPVHRIPHDKLGSVYASRSEIDVWFHNRRAALENGTSLQDTPVTRVGFGRWRVAILFLAAVLVGTAGVLVHLSRTSRARALDNVTVSRLSTSGNVGRAAISPDGDFLAYTTGEPPNETLWTQVLAENREIPLGAGLNIKGLTFSLDSKEIYYVAEESSQGRSELRRIPVFGGTANAVTSGLNSPISFSPDGSHFVFVRESKANGESVLLTARSDGTGERRIISRRLPNYLDYPAWSPDGTRIAATSYDFDAGKGELLEVQLSSGAERRVWSRNRSLIRQPQWVTGNRALIVSAKDDNSGAFQLWRVGLSDGAARKITIDLDNYYRVSLTRDSARLVTVQEQLLTSIWVAPVTGGSPIHRITEETSWHSGVAWTPEGGILYDKLAAPHRNIWLKDRDGSAAKQLTSGATSNLPSACRDGRHIVFLSERSGSQALWRMRADGSSPRLLLEGGEPNYPQCAPDGRWVAYTAIGRQKWPTLWTVSIDGDNAREIDTGHVIAPAVSPDGRRIAAFYTPTAHEPSLQKPPESIAILPATGGQAEMLFPLSPTVSLAAKIRWLPDGQAISYVDKRSGLSEISLQSLDGSPPHPAGEWRADNIMGFDWSIDGQYLCLSQGIRKRDIVVLRGVFK